jgi:O-antigen/teichoic acid export membrane protein
MTKVWGNIAANLVGQGLLVVLGLVAVKFIFHDLGADAVGIIYFSMSASAVLTAMLELGICSTVLRESAMHFETNPKYVERMLRTAATFYWSGYACLATLAWLAAPLLGRHWLSLQSIAPDQAIRAMDIMALGTLTALPRSLYGSLFRGLHRSDITNAIDVSVSASQQGGTMLILRAGGSLIQVTTWFSICFGLGLIAYMIQTMRTVSALSIVPGYSNGVVRQNREYSLKMVWISVLSMVNTQADKLVISRLLPVATLGYYTFIYSIAARGALFSSAVSQALLPHFARLTTYADRFELRREFIRFQELVTAVLSLAFAALVFVAVPLLTMAFTRDIARALVPTVACVAVGFYLNGILTIIYTLTLAVGQPEIVARANLLAFAVIVPATLGLVWAFGLFGAGLAWIGYNAVVCAYIVPSALRRVELRARDWYRCVGRIAAPAILIYATAAAVVHVPMASLASLAIAYLVASMMVAAIILHVAGPSIRSAFGELVAYAGSSGRQVSPVEFHPS